MSARLQDHDRELPVGSGDVGLERRIGLDEARPQRGCFLTCRLARADGATAAADVDFDVAGMGAEVVVPGRALPSSEATITRLSPSGMWITGLCRRTPDFAPVWCRTSSGAPSSVPPTCPRVRWKTHTCIRVIVVLSLQAMEPGLGARTVALIQPAGPL
jgi:hypothetical protein